jgi:hypothetical protein
MGILFWALMISSLIISIIALVIKKPSFFIYAAVCILPLSLYLAATPKFQFIGLIFPFFFVGAAFIIRNYNLWFSIVLISPNFLLIAWLGYAVLNQ